MYTHPLKNECNTVLLLLEQSQKRLHYIDDKRSRDIGRIGNGITGMSVMGVHLMTSPAYWLNLQMDL